MLKNRVVRRVRSRSINRMRSRAQSRVKSRVRIRAMSRVEVGLLFPTYKVHQLLFGARFPKGNRAALPVRWEGFTAKAGGGCLWSP